MFEQVEDQRGRDVVGQVADDAQAGRLLAEPAEVELQGVALVQVEVLAPGELGLKDGDQVQVELDDIQLGAAVEQPFGEGTLPGTDLHQSLTRLGVDRPQNAVDHAGVVQEVLAEAFARAVLVVGHEGSSRLQAASVKQERKAKNERSEAYQLSRRAGTHCETDAGVDRLPKRRPTSGRPFPARPAGCRCRRGRSRQGPGRCRGPPRCVRSAGRG